MEKKRKCTCCKNEKPLTYDYFNKASKSSGYFKYTCIVCRKKLRTDPLFKDAFINRESAIKVKEAKVFINKQIKKYGKDITYLAKTRLQNYNRTDKIKGFDNNLDLVFIIDTISEDCLYCGESDSPRGLDRIDNSKGHTKDNVVPCCSDCNMARADNFTADEMLILGEAIRLIKNKRKN